MSYHSNYTLTLSEEARADLKGILSYTYQKWGEEQQIKYSELLDAALVVLEENPRKGRRHPKLSAEYRYYHAGRHYIVYLTEGQQIQVVRILHDQTDIPRHIH